ncbi:hypothetical protein [Streptosporangium roseum]|nr:hypothetical protein [Streptosporangium roseum]
MLITAQQSIALASAWGGGLDDTNYRVVGGKPVVIDAGDIEKDDLG